MTGKSKNKFFGLLRERAFVYFLVSAIIWVSCIGVYGVRVIKAAGKTHQGGEEENLSLYEKITDYKNISMNGRGLVIDGDGYRFQGNTNENYIMYSSILWRIVSIDKDGNIYMVTEDTLINLPYTKDHTAEYETSLVREFLNGKPDSVGESSFMDQLIEPENYLVLGRFSIDEVGEVSDVLPYEKTVEDDYVGLLNTNDYLISGANEGFLNNKSYFYTMTKKKDTNEVFYVYSDGGMTTFDAGAYDEPCYGVRPVVCLKGSTLNYLGEGTKSSPYRVESKTGAILFDRAIGEYVNFSGYTWRIVGFEGENVKLIMTDVYRDEEGNAVTYKYGGVAKETKRGKTYYDPQLTTSSTVSKYLKAFGESLEEKDKLVKGKFYTGAFNPSLRYSESEVKGDYVKAYVGLPSFYDYYSIAPIENCDGYWLSNYYQDEYDSVWIANQSGVPVTKSFDIKTAIRPVIYLSGKAEVKEGFGTADAPYELTWEEAAK